MSESCHVSFNLSRSKSRKSGIFYILLYLTSLLTLVTSLTNLADVPCGQQPRKRENEFAAEHRGGGNGRQYENHPRNPKIINPKNGETFPGEYPWMVSIKYKDGDHFCGGFLISKMYILSAAHCFNSIKEKFATIDMMKVTLGEYHHYETEKPLDSIDVNISRIEIHPQYDIRYLTHDIVLLKLEKEVSWTSFVQPLCLPDVASEESEVRYDKGTVAGWGQLGETKPASNVLRQVTLPILENHLCQRRFDLARARITVNDFQICAGELFGGADTCLGDSGGPLMVQNNDNSKEDNQMSVVGIVSIGKGCARIGLPGVYTRVRNYIPWIKSQVLGRNASQ